MGGMGEETGPAPSDEIGNQAFVDDARRAGLSQPDEGGAALRARIGIEQRRRAGAAAGVLRGGGEQGVKDQACRFSRKFRWKGERSFPRVLRGAAGLTIEGDTGRRHKKFLRQHDAEEDWREPLGCLSDRIVRPHPFSSGTTLPRMGRLARAPALLLMLLAL